MLLPAAACSKASRTGKASLARHLPLNFSGLQPRAGKTPRRLYPRAQRIPSPRGSQEAPQAVSDAQLKGLFSIECVPHREAARWQAFRTAYNSACLRREENEPYSSPHADATHKLGCTNQLKPPQSPDPLLPAPHICGLLFSTVGGLQGCG